MGCLGSTLKHISGVFTATVSYEAVLLHFNDVIRKAPGVGAPARAGARVARLRCVAHQQIVSASNVE